MSVLLMMVRRGYLGVGVQYFLAAAFDFMIMGTRYRRRWICEVGVSVTAHWKMRVQTYLNGTESMYFLLMVKTK